VQPDEERRDPADLDAAQDVFVVRCEGQAEQEQ